MVNTKFYICISRQYLTPVWDVIFSHRFTQPTEYFGYSIVLTLQIANILERFATSRHHQSLSKFGFWTTAISHVESVPVFPWMLHSPPSEWIRMVMKEVKVDFTSFYPNILPHHIVPSHCIKSHSVFPTLTSTATHILAMFPSHCTELYFTHPEPSFQLHCPSEGGHCSVHWNTGSA